MKRGAAAAIAVVGLLASAAPASASYHLNMIREVHQGAGDTGDYVELQAYAAGQNFVSGKHVVLYDGGGNAFGNVTIPINVSNGSDQATILIAHDVSVAGADVIDADLKVVNTNGSACFTDTLITTGIDCVGWGNAMQNQQSSPFGTPLTAGLPAGDTIPDNGSIVRSIAPGCPTLLELADDSNNSAADFALGTPNPRNNATAPTETACLPPAATNPAGNTPVRARKRKCKKKASKNSVAVAKKKKCKRKKRR